MHRYRKKKKRKHIEKSFEINLDGTILNPLHLEAPEARNFFSFPPTKNHGGMRDHVRANLKSS